LAEAHAIKGRALSEIGRPHEALLAHEESVRLEPDSFDVQASFAYTCILLGRNEEAIAHHERAAQLVETDYISLSMVGACNDALGRQAERKSAASRALQREEKEIALRPDNAHALALSSCDLAALGENERAKEWAMRSLIIDPDDLVNRYNIAGTMAMMNELDDALELLEAYAREMPPSRINRIKLDTSFVPLHGHQRYKALVARAEARWAAVQSDQTAR
jgi:adenylate cyclase